jgi:hypothetical protein
MGLPVEPKKRKLRHMYFLGDTDATANLITLLIIVGVTVPVLWVCSAQITRAKRNMTALADRLGFEVTPNLFIPLIPRSCNKYNNNLSSNEPMDTGIEGSVNGRSVRFVKYVTGSGKYGQLWSEIAVSVRADSFAFTLRPDNVAWKLVESLGHHEIKVGDKEFDRRWRINSNQPETLKAVLLPELRHQIDQSAARQGEFMLEYGYVRYRELGDFDNPKRVARYESMIGLMCDLAEAIEVAAENYRPLSPNSP